MPAALRKELHVEKRYGITILKEMLVEREVVVLDGVRSLALLEFSC